MLPVCRDCAAERCGGAYDEDDAGGLENVARSYDGRDDTAEGEANRTENGRCTPGISAFALHGERCGEGEGECHGEEQQEQDAFIYPKLHLHHRAASSATESTHIPMQLAMMPSCGRRKRSESGAAAMNASEFTAKTMLNSSAENP